MDWNAAFEEQAKITGADYKPRPVTKRVISSFNFTHGDFGYLADPTDGLVEWDGIGDEEPIDEEVEAAQAYWNEEGWNQALSDEADDIGDQKYEASREDRE